MGGLTKRDRTRSQVRLFARLATFARWQPDKWERLHVLADLAGPAANILDVGGRGNELALLRTDADVVSANIRPPADVLYSTHRLPFPDRSFDVVTSSDVLEHLPVSARQEHVDELTRVAQSRLVIGCPLGSEEHAASEARIANLLQARYGLRLDFLEEHIEFGLPTEEQLRSLLTDSSPGSKVELWYHADFRKGEQMLLDGVAARWGHDPRAVGRLLRESYLTRRATTVADHPTPTTNRIYAVMHLDPSDVIGTIDTSPSSQPTTDKAFSHTV
jgi:Methyltransferase domain